ncbi:hypothetical protein FHT93_000919 [Rhizobium sp. BK379]|jgi:hypothetical protein|nr:hypothetical protein [Rhizobium sp. BK379]
MADAWNKGHLERGAAVLPLPLMKALSVNAHSD